MRLPISFVAIIVLVTFAPHAFAAAQITPSAAGLQASAAKPDSLICSWETGLERWEAQKSGSGENQSRKVYLSPKGVTHGTQSLAVDMVPGFRAPVALNCNGGQATELTARMRGRHIAIDVTVPPDACDGPVSIILATCGPWQPRPWIESRRHTIPADGRPHTVVVDALEWRMISEKADWFTMWIITSTGPNAKTGTIYFDNLRILATNPVPPAAEQDAQRALVRQAYAADYKRSAADDQERLAATLRTAAQATDVRYTERYALLTESCEIAARAGDVDSLFESMDLLQELFEATPADLPANYLALAGQNVSPGDADRLALLRRWTALVWQRLAQRDVATAQRAIAAMDGLTRSASGEVKSLVLSRKRECREGIQLTEAAAKEAPKLRDTPDDPGANLAVGKHLCFVAGDWDAGRRFLAKGTASPLQKAAANDIAVGQEAHNLATPQPANNQFRLAQQWWDLAQSEGVLAQIQLRARAAQWYARALPQLSGVSKTVAEKRIPEARASLEAAVFPICTIQPAERTIDLLPLVDVKSDAVIGTWTITDGVLKNLDQSQDSRLQLPYRPPAEYDFEIVFVRHAGDGVVIQALVAGDKRFTWVTGAWWNRIAGFEAINGVLSDRNAASIQRDSFLQNHRRYTCTIKVRKDRVQSFLDGELLVDWKTNYSEMSTTRALPDPRAIGLGSYLAITHFYGIKVTEITGAGEVLRGAQR